MAGIALTPGVIGASLSVQDSAALAAYPVAGITLGTGAYVVSVGANFTLQLSSAALVTDQVVAVAGVTGARWIKDAPVVPLATGTVNGLLPHDNMAALFRIGPALTDANTTRNPETDKAGAYVLPANTLTQARVFTFDEAGALFNGMVFYVVVHPQGFNVDISSVATGLLAEVAPSLNTLVIQVYKGGGGFVLFTGFYGNN